MVLAQVRFSTAAIIAILLSLPSAGFSWDANSQQLYDQGVAFYKQSNFIKAAEKFEQGLNLSKKQNDAQFVCMFAGNLGMVYANLGEYRKVIDLYEKALAIARKLKDSKSEAMILSNLGGAYDSIGDLEKAAKNYRESLKIFRGLKDQKGILANVGNLGIIYDRYGDSATAITYYNESIKTAGEVKDVAGLANMLTNLGIANSHGGDYHGALLHYGQALKQYTDLQDTKGISDVYLNLGIAYSNLGDYASALEYLNQSMEKKTKIGDKKGIADTLGSIGSVYERQGHVDKAIEQYQTAMALQREMGVSTQVLQAKIGDAYIAQKSFGEAKKILEQLGDPVRLGRLELAKGKVENAAAYFETALKTNPDSRDPMFLFAANCGMGQSLLNKNFSEAKEYLDKAILYNEEQRDSLNEVERSRFFQEKVYGFSRVEPYESMQELLCRFSSPKEAFAYSESLKARILSESISAKFSGLRGAMPDDVKSDEDAVNIEVRAIRKVLQYAHAANEKEMYKGLESQLKEALDKRNSSISDLRKKYPEYASVAYPQPVKPSEVKLGSNEVLLEFEVCKEKTYVFVCRNNSLSVREIPISREALKHLALEYHDAFENINDYSDLAKFSPTLSDKLYGLLLAGALKDIPANASLIIVPDEFLGLIPFESLICSINGKEKMGEGKFGAFPLNVTYLADRYTVRYAQSATTYSMLKAQPKQPPQKDSVLVVCDPIFSENDPRAGKLNNKGVGGDDARAINLRKMGAMRLWGSMGVAGTKQKGGAMCYDGPFPRLEKTEKLINIANTFFGMDNAVSYSGLQASEKQVRESGLGQYKYVIFATHGILDANIPWIKEPALALSQINNEPPYDGFLTMSEIMGMKIPAQLAFLGACRSGVGEEVSGEGVMGLGRAFQYAGCANTVISLWSVNEDATVALIAELLANVKEGIAPERALQLAKQKIRQNGYEHPFYWSAFVIY